MAEQAIATRLTPLPSERRPLEACCGRTLREDIYAERDNPPFDRVCMDGVAIDSNAFGHGVRRYVIQATQPAGAPALTLTAGENAIEVMTGAILPRGTDCVIPLEEYDLAGNVLALKADVQAEPFRNVQRRGSDSEPGAPMLRAGVRLDPPELGVVASAGLASVSVSRQPRFIIISTGDELVEPGAPIAEHQVRRSNVYAVIAALRQRGFDKVANDHLLDDERILSERLARHLSERDVLVLSGGVSKGKFDLVPKVLKDIGVEEVFYQVAQRPGMPMWFGVGQKGQLVFGLPGNPVSTLVCLVRYVIPAIATAMGAEKMGPDPIALGAPFKFNRPMTYFLPVALQYDEQGRVCGMPRVPNGSGDFLALTHAAGFVELPPRTAGFPAGFVADFYRW